MQDTTEELAYERWGASDRDIIIVDAFNRPVAKDNLTTHDLQLELYRSALIAAIVKAATPIDSDKDQLPDDWEIGWFGSLVANPNADADGDGASNLTEFLFATNPVDAKSRPLFQPSITRSAGQPSLSVVFRRFSGSAADFVVETSPDLVHWSSGPADLLAGVTTPLYDGFGGTQVRYEQTRKAGALTSGFIRVRPVVTLKQGSTP